MTKYKGLSAGCAAGMALVAVSSAHAAYPTQIKVDVEVWNNTSQIIQLTSASWISQASELGEYTIPAGNAGAAFDVVLNNPRDDAGAFRYATADGKVCEFKFSHKKTFSWFGLNPAPEKSASVRSIGAVAAQCDASVIKGTKSQSGYTVRYSMR